jgi:hypothetical protein
MNRGEILQPIANTAGRAVDMLSRHRVAGIVTASLALGSVAAISASVNSDRSQDEAQPELLTPEQQAQADALCTPEAGEQTFDMSIPIEEEFAIGTVGNETTAVLPSFVTFGPNGEKTLAEPEEVANTILDKNCLSATLLGIFDGVLLESAGVGQEGSTFSLDQTIIDRIQSNAEYFRIDPKAALRSLNLLASVIAPTKGAASYDGGVTYVDDFAVTRGKAGIIGTIRNDAGKAKQIGMTKVASDGVFEGWQIAFPEEGLTEEQIAIARAVTGKLLITPNGDIIIADWFGPGATNFEPSDQSPTTVAVTEAPDATDFVTEDTTGQEQTDDTNVSGGQEADDEQEGPNDGDTDEQDDGGSGGNPGGNGPGCEGTVGGDCDGEGPGGPGDGVPETDPTQPPTTPAPTTAPSTTRPPTTPPPTTAPSTTRPPTTPPPTTAPSTTRPPTTPPPTPPTTPPKGAEPPCDTAVNPRCINGSESSNGMSGDSLPLGAGGLLAAGALLSMMYVNGGFGKARTTFERLGQEKKKGSK